MLNKQRHVYILELKLDCEEDHTIVGSPHQYTQYNKPELSAAQLHMHRAAATKDVLQPKYLTREKQTRNLPPQVVSPVA